MLDLTPHPHVGAALIGAVFLWSALQHALNFRARVAMLSGKGWPTPAPLLLAGMGLEVFGGGLLIAGVLMHWAAAALVLFTVVASVTLLDFWRQPAETRHSVQNAFIGNIALIGGLLLAACRG
jgi:putative oxidoreductase